MEDRGSETAGHRQLGRGSAGDPPAKRQKGGPPTGSEPDPLLKELMAEARKLAVPGYEAFYATAGSQERRRGWKDII